MKSALASILILLGCCRDLACAQAAEVLTAWTYYAAPPFLTDARSNAGLDRDLVAYLNQKLAGKYEVRLMFVPRARLGSMLDTGARGMVLFAPSVIFDGPAGGKYLWTSALFDDRQDLLSRASAPFEYDGPGSLHGVRFGAMLGHSYPALAEDVASGRIHAHRNNNEGALLKMLLMQRLDVITLADSSVRYLVRNDASIAGKIHVSKQNLGSYTRHLMFQQGMTRERDDIEEVVARMDGDPAWLAILRKYGLTHGAR
ncbi:transporter substrate-binding domain-containing protein [Rugamonas sp. FT107W]|uniref:Transporter substrate-binding domain-containing protein n=1 Tax=Duganella vulcania TaxID=2692166 RepID=A0A845HGD3_9BURK|nr:transporter substrate-binding domain-containing protein [Duganella vulcania]MYN16569.1 transporter substrate-binding domain-containing protein [Duganella vulcania]